MMFWKCILGVRGVKSKYHLCKLNKILTPVFFIHEEDLEVLVHLASTKSICCWCQNPNELVSDSISDPCISIKFVWWEAGGWSPRRSSDYEQNIHEQINFKLMISKYLKLQRMFRGAGSFFGVNSPTLKSVIGFIGKTKSVISHRA